MGSKQSAEKKVFGSAEVLNQPIIEWMEKKPAKPSVIPSIEEKSDGEIEITTDPQKAKVMEKQLRKKAKEIGIDSKDNYNFAFIGAVGVGKTTMINSLLGVFGGVDEFESTKVITPYAHPTYKIVFWDFPGCGTTDVPSDKYFANYFVDRNYCVFDHLIIVVGERLTLIELKIAKQAKTFGIPFDFVRSKADNDLSQLRKGKMKNATNDEIKAAYRKQINDNFVEQTAKVGMQLNKEIYIVSWPGFDFENVHFEEDYVALNEMDERKVIQLIMEASIRRRND